MPTSDKTRRGDADTLEVKHDPKLGDPQPNHDLPTDDPKPGVPDETPAEEEAPEQKAPPTSAEYVSDTSYAVAKLADLVAAFKLAHNTGSASELEAAIRELELLQMNMATETATQAPAPLTLVKDLPDGAVGAAYEGSVSTTGGLAPVNVVVGNLPAGLTSDKGKITGTPTGAGVFILTVSATDSAPTPVNVTDSPRLTIA